MEGPIARIAARSLSRVAKHGSSAVMTTNQQRHLSTSLTTRPAAKLPFASVACRKFSQNNCVFNQTKKDVTSSGETASVDRAQTGQVPTENASESPPVKPFDSDYEESSIGNALQISISFSRATNSFLSTEILVVAMRVFALRTNPPPPVFQ